MKLNAATVLSVRRCIMMVISRNARRQCSWPGVRNAGSAKDVKVETEAMASDKTPGHRVAARRDDVVALAQTFRAKCHVLYLNSRLLSAPATATPPPRYYTTRFRFRFAVL